MDGLERPSYPVHRPANGETHCTGATVSAPLSPDFVAQDPGGHGGVERPDLSGLGDRHGLVALSQQLWRNAAPLVANHEAGRSSEIDLARRLSGLLGGSTELKVS